MDATVKQPDHPKLTHLKAYENYLIEEEKAPATIEKYTRDIRALFAHVGSRPLTKTLILDYKHALQADYTDTSTNSMLSALNGFFTFCRREDLHVKQLKVQHTDYLPEEKVLSKDEYQRLLEVAKKQRPQLYYIMHTLSATGIRISELPFITKEAVLKGHVQVRSKGKTRLIFLPKHLQRLLRCYLKQAKISQGPLFLNKKGVPISRHVVWAQMKRLCKQANVVASKVFPHNLRHLFARCFYALTRDVVKLADLLGHASVDTTRIYTAETGEEHRKTLELMPIFH